MGRMGCWISFDRFVAFADVFIASARLSNVRKRLLVCVTRNGDSQWNNVCQLKVFSGYLGPGGLSDDGSHYTCTGGAAQLVDRTILSTYHMYQTPTCQVKKF